MACSTAQHSFVNCFTICRHDGAVIPPTVASTATSSSSLFDQRQQQDEQEQEQEQPRQQRRRQEQQQYGNDVYNCDDVMSTYYDRFRKFRTDAIHAPHIHRVFLLSDLHMDYIANREWLSNLCSPADVASSNIVDDGDDNGTKLEDTNAMIVVAGDVSHNLDILRWTFQTLKTKYGEVSYTPGNHELWIDNQDHYDDNVHCTAGQQHFGRSFTSLDKLEKVLQLCLDENVRIGPMRVGGRINGNSQPSLWVIPLLSWHHPSFDTEPPIECWGGIPSARKVVADYRRTRWPPPLSLMDDSIANFIDGLNDVVLDLCGLLEIEGRFMDADLMNDVEITPMTMLTFSHFIPRVELLPEKRYLSLPTLPRCVGSTFLETRLRQMGNHYSLILDKNEHNYDENTNANKDGGKLDYENITNNNDKSNGRRDGAVYNQNHRLLHAFGHTHLAWDATLDGVRYVHVPLAYPREWEQRRRSLEIGSMKGEIKEDRFPVCLWDCNAIIGGKENAIYPKSLHPSPDTAAVSSGFPSQWLGGWWSKYYSDMPRKPHMNTELAPWVANRFR